MPFGEALSSSCAFGQDCTLLPGSTHLSGFPNNSEDAQTAYFIVQAVLVTLYAAALWCVLFQSCASMLLQGVVLQPVLPHGAPQSS